MIGIFDSGFGGLTILKAILRELPQYDYIYLGDNARAPYGNKSQSLIYSYTVEAVQFLFKQGCQLVIVACNTASAKALRQIQRQWLPARAPEQRVLGVVVPIVEAAADQSPSGRIGVIGTTATVNSGVFKKELSKLNNQLQIYERACPLLVPLVEETWLNKPETRMILKKYLRPLKQKRIDTLILGCTHYSFLSSQIKRLMGKNCRILDPPEIIATKLADYLKRHPEIENQLERGGKLIFYTTDEAATFKRFGEKYLGRTIKEVRQVEL